MARPRWAHLLVRIPVLSVVLFDWGRWARWVCDATENFHGDVALYIDVYIHLYTTGIVRGILCMVQENMVENIRHIPNCFVFGSFCVRELQQHEVWTTVKP